MSSFEIKRVLSAGVIYLEKLLDVTLENQKEEIPPHVREKFS